MTQDLTALFSVVDLLTDAINDGIEVAADGKVSILEVVKFANLIPDIIPAVAALPMVPSELKALQLTDADAIVQHVMKKLNIGSTPAIAVTQAAAEAAYAIYHLVMVIKTPSTATN